MNGSKESSKRHLLKTTYRISLKDEKNFAGRIDEAKISRVIYLLKVRY